MNQKQIRKILSESTINPKTLTGPMKLIFEQNDPHYMEMRAKEFIGEAQLSLGFGSPPTSHQLEMYHDKVAKAITLLLMARILRTNEVPKKPTNRSK